MIPPSREVIDTTPGFNAGVLFTFLRRWAIPGVEHGEEGNGSPTYARAMRLSHGPGAVLLTWTGGVLLAEIQADPADHEEVRRKVSALSDVSADAAAIDARLGADGRLAALVSECPGMRIPGTTDPHELAIQALIGQQISMAAAAVCAAKITRSYGDELEHAPFGLGWLFPTAARLAGIDPTQLPMPRARGRALVGLAAALADGRLDLTGRQPWSVTRAALLALPGIGPWTADYIGLRAMGQRDILLSTDLVIKRELAQRGIIDTEAWSPFRSYLTLHLWRSYV